MNNQKINLLPFVREDVLSIQDIKQQFGWEITAFNLPTAWQYTKGEGVVIAVLDTGADLDHDDLIENLLPGKNFVSPNDPPIDDNGHGCVSPETLIHTSYSGIQEIEELYDSLHCEEKTIETIDGKYTVKDLKNLKIKTLSLDSKLIKTVVSDVSSIQKLQIKKEIIHLELEGNISFYLTPWHPAYILKNKHHDVYEVLRKRADEILVGDLFVFPEKTNFGEKQTIKYNNVFICKNCSHQPKYCLGEIPSCCKKCKSNDWNYTSKNIEITSDLAWLCGIVITDGYVHLKANRIEVSSNTKEILEKVKIITNNLGFKNCIEKNRILVYGKDIVKIMISLGVLHKNKSLKQNLPNWVGKVDHITASAFVAGVVDGDGCISKNNTKNRITTGSLQFAKEFCALLNYLGISSGISKPNFDKRKRFIQSKNPVYKINHTALDDEIIKNLSHPEKILRSSKKLKYKRKCRRVKKIEIKKYDGYFYDFTVEKYHNYIANGHFVSNTHVTGIICASNNAQGMVGVAPSAKVIPIKVLNEKGSGELINVANGIRWAADQGADFITMSLGAPNPMKIIEEAIVYAESKGSVTFCAAGNAGKTRQIFYPAAYSQVIGIGAIDENFDRASFSCTGPDLDFLAPGVGIFSTVPENWYAKLSGTSMANPFAVGVAALLLSHKRKKNLNTPLKTNKDYIDLLKQYTIPTRNPDFANQKFFEGFGIIDPRKMEEWVKSV